MRKLALAQKKWRYSFSDQLGSEKFRFSLWWCLDVQAWFISIEGLTNDFKRVGRRLSVGSDLFGPYRKGYGALILVGPEYGDLTAENLGDTFHLYWFSEEEKADIL